MGFSLTSPAPEKCDPTAKNRVWGFFGEAPETSRPDRPQSLQPRREKHPTTTKVASGRTYWPSRDPIGERGGINLYGMVGNNVVGNWDLLGLEEMGCCCLNSLNVYFAQSRKKSIRQKGGASVHHRVEAVYSKVGNCNPKCCKLNQFIKAQILHNGVDKTGDISTGPNGITPLKPNTWTLEPYHQPQPKKKRLKLGQDPSGGSMRVDDEFVYKVPEGGQGRIEGPLTTTDFIYDTPGVNTSGFVVSPEMAKLAKTDGSYSGYFEFFVSVEDTCRMMSFSETLSFGFSFRGEWPEIEVFDVFGYEERN